MHHNHGYKYINVTIIIYSYILYMDCFIRDMRLILKGGQTCDRE